MKKETLDYIWTSAVWGSLLLWLGYSIVTSGFTEPVIWVLSGIGCLAFTAFIFAGASMAFGSAIGSMLLIGIVWSLFAGALLLRLFQLCF